MKSASICWLLGAVLVCLFVVTACVVYTLDTDTAVESEFHVQPSVADDMALEKLNDCIMQVDEGNQVGTCRAEYDRDKHNQ